MKNLITTVCLTIAVLLGSSGSASALPPCSSDQIRYYDECVGKVTLFNGGGYIGEFRNVKLEKVSNQISRSTLNCVFDRNYPDPFLAGQTGTLTIDRGRGLLTLQFSRKAQARMAIWKKIQVHHDNIVGTETLTRDGSEFVINRYKGSANYHRGGMKKIYLSDPNKYRKAKNLMNLKMVCSKKDKNRIL